MHVFVCNDHYWCNIVDLLFAADIGNVPTGPASEDVDDDDVPGRCYLRVWLRKMETVSNTYTLPFTINTIHRGVHWSLLTRDILYTNKLAKPPFFFTYSRLCHHCRNLAEGSCLLTPISFYTLSLLLGSYCLSHLTWKGPWYTGYQFWSKKSESYSFVWKKREDWALSGSSIFLSSDMYKHL